MQPTHHHLQELLIWYANGRLSEWERTEIESHLKHCVQCRATLSQLQLLRQAVKQADRVTNSNDKPPYRKRRHRVGMWYGNAGLTRFAAAAAILIVFAIGIHPYTPLREPSYRSATQTRHTELKVAFVPTATEVSIRHVLEKAGAKIIQGPSEEGIYIIAIRAEDDTAVMSVLRQLREQDTVVRLVKRK